jgi:hypothetical protein
MKKVKITLKKKKRLKVLCFVILGMKGGHSNPNGRLEERCEN